MYLLTLNLIAGYISEIQTLLCKKITFQLLLNWYQLYFIKKELLALLPKYVLQKSH